MSHRHERTIARQAALQVLYSGEITDMPPTELVECGACIEEDAPIDDYAFLLIEGVEQHCDELDALLEEVSQNWALTRMPIVDRQILRIAVFEMKYVDDVNTEVWYFKNGEAVISSFTEAPIRIEL